MPNLEFCALGDDQAAVLDAVFRLGAFRVFEAYSEPDSELREFGAPSEVPDDPHGPYLMLYVVGSGPEPSAKRIDTETRSGCSLCGWADLGGFLVGAQLVT